ncbi:MAG TPA: hypothetical protein ENN54_02495 [Thermoplasmatales archaeon]|nr:hypothetical protein [Thermoplasmatales archaeon]
MKKALCLLVVSVLVVSGAVFATTATDTPPAAREKQTGAALQTVTASVHFDTPRMTADGHYLRVATTGATDVLRAQTTPLLPYRTETMTFPVGTSIGGVSVTYDRPQSMAVPGKISPAPLATAYNMKAADATLREGPVYVADAFYPDSWYDWSVGVGLDGRQHVLYLSVHLYPARYNPSTATLEYVNDMDITVTYTPGVEPLTTADEFDLLIVTPEDFSEALQPLVEHKDSHGVATRLVTLGEVYGGAFFDVQGRDQAEQVKYFIKNAVEDWGVRYVMLVGGRNGGLLEEKWWCPVRYSHLDDNSNWEASYLSDLYFADIYKYDNDEVVFEDWDSNGNGVFAEWRMMSKDILDLYPDVYVGRLACRNNFEVQEMVEKIITYETTTHGSDWANTFLGIGGDTFPIESDPYLEGELAISASADYLAELGVTATLLRTSDGTLSGSHDVVGAISEGYGFLNFEGHGNPMGWATHPPHDDEVWINGLKVGEMPQLSNDGMYPVCIVGGCHNSQFNVTLLNLLKIYEGYERWYEYLYKGEISPESFSWWLARKIGGGAIATVGCTGLGYGAIGDYNDDGVPDCIQRYGGFIDIEFFRVYAQEGKDILGEAHGTAVANYVQQFPPMKDQIDAKTVQGWVLLGDPSLKIGGYPS